MLFSAARRKLSATIQSQQARELLRIGRRLHPR